MNRNRVATGPNRWAGLQAVAMLHRLNARCFAMLADVFRREGAPLQRSPIYRDPELWERIDEVASERAGRCPVLLLDLNFDHLDWWKRICGASAGVAVTEVSPVLIDDAQSKALLREILMEVWHLGRSRPRAANFLFGMAPGVTAQISDLSIREVDWIAVNYARNLRPRWEENVVFWRNLLEAALSPDEEALFGVHLHCLQLLGSSREM